MFRDVHFSEVCYGFRDSKTKVTIIKEGEFRNCYIQ
jgi:hypothetical protein